MLYVFIVFIGYIVARSLGKYFGAFIGCKLTNRSKSITKYLGITLLPQAGVAIGMANQISSMEAFNNDSGNIIVNVGGKEHTVYLSDKETIGSFISKLESIGVEADFNERTGVFSASIGSNHIYDSGHTGIVNALHLSTVNKGFGSNQLHLNSGFHLNNNIAVNVIIIISTAVG